MLLKIYTNQLKPEDGGIYIREHFIDHLVFRINMKENNKPFKAVVIGGGLVGSLAAVYLANKGVEVLLFEKRSLKITSGFIHFNHSPDIRKDVNVSGKSINLALSTRGIEALARSGIDLSKHMIPMHSRMIHYPNGKLDSQAYGNNGEVFIQLTNSVLTASTGNGLIRNY
jgi:2-polyprenyl-6-methoxyphenol hydroxylase-like FAD-dependent oxidoreductase